MRAIRPPCLAWLLAFAIGSACAEELIDVPVRDGVTLSFLYAESSVPRAVAILFPGGDGQVDLPALRDRLKLARGNFLVRSRKYFVDAGVATALVTVPSDRSQGMDDTFRRSDDHATDLRAVIAAIKRRHPQLPIFLVGTSRGTVSAAALGASLADRIAGVVLTATVTESNRPGRVTPQASSYDFSRLAIPVLLVHHRDDACWASPYSGAQALAQRYPLITVHGGAAPQSGPCLALTPHGFLGQEQNTVAAITAWILGRPHPRTIE